MSDEIQPDRAARSRGSKRPPKAIYPRKAIGELGMPAFGPTDLQSGAWQRFCAQHAQDRPVQTFIAAFEAAVAYFWSDEGQELWGADPGSQQQFLLDQFEFHPGVEKRLRKWLEDHPGVDPPPEDGLSKMPTDMNLLTNDETPVDVPSGVPPLRRGPATLG